MSLATNLICRCIPINLLILHKVRDITTKSVIYSRIIYNNCFKFMNNSKLDKKLNYFDKITNVSEVNRISSNLKAQKSSSVNEKVTDIPNLVKPKPKPVSEPEPTPNSVQTLRKMVCNSCEQRITRKYLIIKNKEEDGEEYCHRCSTQLFPKHHLLPSQPSYRLQVE